MKPHRHVSNTIVRKGARFITMPTISGESPELRALGRALKGSITLPGDSDYDRLRKPWLEVIDQHPALIVEAACVQDVVAAVKFARTERLELGVMSTGHGIAAPCDGVLLRFTNMHHLSVDTSRKVATISPGVLSSELLEATEKHGFGYPAGQVGNVGVMGFALGGGLGWLVRKLGAATDWVVGADVLLADGSLVRADATSHGDLFWALRGGGGNFGVVVSLEMALAVPEVVGGEVYFPRDRAAELLRFYREWSSQLPDETSTVFRLVAIPPAPTAPAPIRGKTVCMFGVCHSNPGDADEVLAPLDSLGRSLLNDVKRRTLSSMAGLDPASHSPGAPAYGGVEHLKALSDDVIDGLARLAETMIPPLMQFEVQQLGGALVRAADQKSGAFQPPSAPYLLHIESPAIQAPLTEIAKTTADAFAALGDAFTGERAFGSGRFERLREIKHRYDPANVFHLNLNVAPSSTVDV